MRHWKFIADMNGDSAVTISDVWLWVKWLFFYPGDLLVQGVLSGWSSVAVFFEMSSASYGGFFSGFASVILWAAAIWMLFSREMWVSAQYDKSKPFWKREYGFWPMMLLYGAAIGIFIGIVALI